MFLQDNFIATPLMRSYENMDRIHFVINMDNGRTLGFHGDKQVKYVSMVYRGIGITMVVNVTRGYARKVGTLFLFFQNLACSYSILGAPYDVQGVLLKKHMGLMTGDFLKIL